MLTREAVTDAEVDHRLETWSHRARVLSGLMAERSDLNGVIAMADLVTESICWGA